MELIYNKYKDYKVKYKGGSAYVCGYTSSHLIGAIQADLQFTFKKPKNGSFIDTTNYDHISYHFCYIDESTILKQIREEKFTTPLKIEDLEVEL
jgi:hypothetical protein